MVTVGWSYWMRLVHRVWQPRFGTSGKLPPQNMPISASKQTSMEFTPRTDDLYHLYDLYDLYDLRDLYDMYDLFPIQFVVCMILHTGQTYS